MSHTPQFHSNISQSTSPDLYTKHQVHTYLHTLVPNEARLRRGGGYFWAVRNGQEVARPATLSLAGEGQRQVMSHRASALHHGGGAVDCGIVAALPAKAGQASYSTRIYGEECPPTTLNTHTHVPDTIHTDKDTWRPPASPSTPGEDPPSDSGAPHPSPPLSPP